MRCTALNSSGQSMMPAATLGWVIGPNGSKAVAFVVPISALYSAPGLTDELSGFSAVLVLMPKSKLLVTSQVFVRSYAAPISNMADCARNTLSMAPPAPKTLEFAYTVCGALCG